MTQITSGSTIGRMTNVQGLPPVTDQVNPVANRFDHPRVSGHLRIPMVEGNRSLNLANSASIALYEAWRQLGFPDGV